MLSYLILCFSCIQASAQFPNFNKAPETPAIFGPGIISTSNYERDFALSPDGNEIFYTLQAPLAYFQTIVHLVRDPSGNWSKPMIAPFSGNFSDLEPAFSADGKKLYFASNRPLTGTEKKDFDIWVVEKKADGWGSPRNLGKPVNTNMDEFYPSITHSGNLYFTASYPGGKGKEDIYMARWNGSSYDTPLSLDSGVNSAAYEFNAYVSPKEDYILFTSYGRAGEKGGGDLYISTRASNGSWKPAINLAFLNTNRLDYCPFVSPDQKVLFFTSDAHQLQSTYPAQEAASYGQLNQAFNGLLNGNGNIYWVSFAKVLELTR